MNTIFKQVMTIEQAVDIPADRRLTIEVPPEVPAGRTIISFTPAKFETPGGESVASARKRWFQMNPEERAAWEARDVEIINRHAEELNAEAMDVLRYQAEIFDDR